MEPIELDKSQLTSSQISHRISNRNLSNISIGFQIKNLNNPNYIRKENKIDLKDMNNNYTFQDALDLNKVPKKQKVNQDSKSKIKNSELTKKNSYKLNSNSKSKIRPSETLKNINTCYNILNNVKKTYIKSPRKIYQNIYKPKLKTRKKNIEKTLLNTPTNKQNLPVLVGYLKN